MTTTSSYDTTAMWDLARVAAPATNRDGSVVVVPVTTSPTGVARTVLYRLRPDGDHEALTDIETSSSDPAVSPQGGRVAFVRTVDGHRQAHVTVTGGPPRRATGLPAGTLGSPLWVDEHRLLVVTTLWAGDPTLEATRAWQHERESGPDVHATERRVNRVWDTWYEDDATQHVLLVDTRDDDATPLDLTPGHWLLPDPLSDPGEHCAVSPDGTLLAFTTADAHGDADGVPVPHLRVVPLTGGEVVDLTPDATAQVGAPAFLPDGRVVVLISRERDFYAAPSDLWAIDPTSGAHERILGDVDHGIDSVTVAADGRIVIATTLRGRGRLLDVRGGTTRPLGGDHAGSLGSPIATTGGLYAVSSSLTAPPEVVEVDEREVRTVTSFARGALQGVDLGRLEERTVAGADGDDVQLLVLRPPGLRQDDEPAPLLHLVHGGPHGHFGDEWHWRWNAARFVADGWVVALVNFHGSTGFGHDFTRSIHGDWASAPTADVLAATDALVADGTVDPDRMAIAGGSYGGYLVTWLCTVTDRFATAVAHAAVTDIAGMMASDWTTGFDVAHGGRPWEGGVALAHSPATRFGEITTPMLVIHGERDLRVPIDQGRSLYGALKDRGVESRLLVFPDENHWVLDRAASERWYAEVLDWLHRSIDV